MLMAVCVFVCTLRAILCWLNRKKWRRWWQRQRQRRRVAANHRAGSPSHAIIMCNCVVKNNTTLHYTTHNRHSTNQTTTPNHHQTSTKQRERALSIRNQHTSIDIKWYYGECRRHSQTATHAAYCELVLYMLLYMIMYNMRSCSCSLCVHIR